MAWRADLPQLTICSSQLTPTHNREYNELQGVGRGPFSDQWDSGSNAVMMALEMISLLDGFLWIDEVLFHDKVKT